MAMIRWHRGEDLFSQLERMASEMERLRAAARPTVREGARPDVYPPMNVYSDREGYVVRAEVPGVAPAELDLEVSGDTLTLRGERKAPPMPEGASFHRRERSFGTFSRSLTLPEQVDSSRVSASFADGILEIRLPNAEATGRRKIDVHLG